MLCTLRKFSQANDALHVQANIRQTDQPFEIDSTNEQDTLS